MSIPPAIIQAQVTAGRLFPLMPLSPRAPVRRGMFVAPEVWARLQGEADDEVTEERYGRLRADLEAFTTLSALYPKYAYWLSPKRDAVWEIRSVEDVPSIRVLGRFAKRDVFVALTIEERSELEGWNSQQWRRAIRTCCQRWASIFDQYLPLTGAQASDFFSGSVPASYFKK